MTPYIVYYRYQAPDDKKPGPVRQYRLYANNYEEARLLVTQHSNYPNIEVLDIKPA